MQFGGMGGGMGGVHGSGVRNLVLFEKAEQLAHRHASFAQNNRMRCLLSAKPSPTSDYNVGTARTLRLPGHTRSSACCFCRRYGSWRPAGRHGHGRRHGRRHGWDGWWPAEGTRAPKASTVPARHMPTRRVSIVKGHLCALYRNVPVRVTVRCEQGELPRRSQRAYHTRAPPVKRDSREMIRRCRGCLRCSRCFASAFTCYCGCNGGTCGQHE